MGDWNSGSDAAYMKPRFVPDEALHGLDDSGPPDMDKYHAMFGDGGRITNPKAYLMVRKGKE